MTWRLYALTSGGAVLVTALATLVTPIKKSTPEVQSPVPQALNRSGTIVDLGVQADRLKSKLAEVSAYREPARNAFHFGAAPRPVSEPVAPPPIIDAPSVDIAPPRPPYALAGMATSIENGTPVRTAILSSLRGVSLVKEGDILDGAYRVVSVTEDAMTLEALSDRSQTTLRFSNSDTR